MNFRQECIADFSDRHGCHEETSQYNHGVPLGFDFHAELAFKNSANRQNWHERCC